MTSFGSNIRLAIFVLFLLQPLIGSTGFGAEASANYLLSAPHGIYVGSDYYPEHWPEERWETDLRMMKEAGFNIVRVAEFSWVLFEPREGEYHFEWLDKWLTMAEAHGIKVIMGTPTAIMPAWLAKKYPEALEMRQPGKRTTWGGRRHNCYSDADYRRLADGVVSALAKHYAHHPAVVGWQIDNEFGSADCRCEKCQAKFQAWLTTKYGDVSELNRAWGTHFWGQRLSDWSEVPIPDDRMGDWAISNPSASLDWQRFMSDQQVEFLDRQVGQLREHCPTQQFITHNFMGLHDTINYFHLAKKLDFVSWDNYPKLAPAIHYDSSLSADLMRGLKKKNFLVMEQTAGPLGWSTFSKSPEPGELRKICYQQLAHGADGQIWFRWRSCTVGREQYWHGLLGHDGGPNRRYREAAQIAQEYRKLAPHLAGTTPKAQVALIFDYDSLWALKIQQGYSGASHVDAIRRYYNALFRHGVNVDVVSPGDDLNGYQLVLAPHLHILADKNAQQLSDYVKGGGVLLTDCRTAVKDETSLIPPRKLPGLLAPVLGMEIEEYESLSLGLNDGEQVTYSITTTSEPTRTYTSIRYADWIRPTSAQPMAHYTRDDLKPYAAVTRNSFGLGVGWYVGTILREDEFYDRLLTQVLADAKIAPDVVPPPGVEAATRQGSSGSLLFLINHTAQEKVVQLPAGKTELLAGVATAESTKLPPFGVAVIDLPRESQK